MLPNGSSYVNTETENFFMNILFKLYNFKSYGHVKWRFANGDVLPSGEASYVIHRGEKTFNHAPNGYV